MSTDPMKTFRAVVEFSANNEEDAYEILEDQFPQGEIIGKISEVKEASKKCK